MSILFDPHALITIDLVSMLIGLLTMLLLWLLNRETPGVNYLLLAATLIITSLLLLLQDELWLRLPPWLWILSINLPYISALWLVTAGLYRFLARPIPWSAIGGILLCYGVALAWFTWIQPSPVHRAILTTTTLVINMVWNIHYAHRWMRQRYPYTYRLMLILGGSIIVLLLWRLSLLPQPQQPGSTVASPAMTLLFFAMMTSNHLLTLLFVALSHEKKSEQLIQAATHDPLTGLLNRRGMQLAIERWQQAARATSGAVILVDVDHFKRINDTLGHDKGDDILVWLAQMLQPLPVAGHVSRHGGEEFLLFLPDIDLSDAAAVAEQLRQRLQDHPPQGLTVTASFGVATLNAASPLRAALHEADLALYQAKQSGRNRVEVASSLP